METIINFLRRRIITSDHETRFFDDEISRVVHIIHDTVVNGVSNSMLIIGRRGSGKSHLLREAIKKARLISAVNENLIEIHVNVISQEIIQFFSKGLIHTDDRLALYTIAKQLRRVCSNLNVNADLFAFPSAEGFVCENGEGGTGGEKDIRRLGFTEQLQWLLAGLQTSNNATSKALLVVLEEFDLLAAHRNQALLYNLLDISCHADGIPICVIGVTCRLDVMEMLEKRVKSRFSHRLLHVISVTAPSPSDASIRGTVNRSDDYGGDNIGSDSSSPFHRYRLLSASLLLIDKATLCKLTSKVPSSEGAKLTRLAAQWNTHVEAFFEDDMVKDCLRQTWEVTICVRKLQNIVALLISRLGDNRTILEPSDFINVLSRLRQNAMTSLLPGLSLLELILVTVMVKLHDINEDQYLNFEMVFREYSRFCKVSCPAYLFEKEVVSKAIDNLVKLELVVCGREALMITTNVGARQCNRRNKANLNVSTTPNLPCQLRRFQPLACFVPAPLLLTCLDSYPGCPIELIQWAHSRTM